MWLHLAIFALALVVLVKSADYLVEYSARVARRFQVSDLVVGLIITSVGTSMPEFASSLSAAFVGSPGP
jgi:Ca2+/Na+ antiporter